MDNWDNDKRLRYMESDKWDKLVELLKEYESVHIVYLTPKGITRTNSIPCYTESDIWDAKDKGYNWTGDYITVGKQEMTQYGQKIQ